MERNIHVDENVDRELQNMNQGEHLKIKEETFESDKSLLENIDYTHCFETIDSQMKMEIDAHDTEKQNPHSQNNVNQHLKIFSGFQNLNQQDRLFKVEKFETVDYTHNFENSDSNCEDIYRFHQNMDTALCNIKQEVEVNKGRWESFENADSDLPKDSIGNSCVNIDSKPSIQEKAAFWNKESGLDFDNNGSFIYMCHGDIRKSENESFPINENLNLKIEPNGLNLDQSDLKPENVEIEINNCVSDANGLDFVNDKCEAEDRTLSHLRKDMTTHSIEQSLKYNFSKQNFETVEFPNIHMPVFRDSTETRHKCHICEKEFNTKVNLRKHKMCHKTERPHICITCEARFKTRAHLRRHMVSHTTERPYKCNICENGFKTIFELRMHMASHSNDRPNKCNICEKEFKTMSHLRRHMSSHSTERPHQCNICETGFKTMSHLRIHLITHSTERLHQCNICEKRFKTKDNLRGHIISHSTDKPHQCNICETGFKAMSELRRHMVSHSTETPHKCTLCDKEFKIKSYLKKHMAIHSTEHPHTCNMCRKRFRCQLYLNRHVHSHHRDSTNV